MSSSPLYARAASVRAAVSLYRRCLRSARRCPAFEKKEELLKYTRLRYEDSRGVRDPAVVKHLLALGEEELLTMNSFHAAREAKEREARTSSTSGAVESSPRFVDLASPPPSHLQVPPLAVVASSSSDATSIFQLLDKASFSLHNIDTAPIVTSSKYEGTLSFQRLAEASVFIGRANSILSIAKTEALAALAAANEEIETLEEIAAGAQSTRMKSSSSTTGTATKTKVARLQGAKEFYDAIEAARAALRRQ